MTDPAAICRADNCTHRPTTAGYCPRHYQQLRRHGRLTPEREYQKLGATCQAANCSRPQTAKGYCPRHYQQVRRHGRPTPERERTYRRLGCKIPGCAKPHAARGYCKPHYMKLVWQPPAETTPPKDRPLRQTQNQ